MKLITKIRKASSATKKTEIFQDADLDRCDAEGLVKEMILSLPGHYKLHSREYGTNLVDKVYDVYGWMPSMLISENMIRGLHSLYPKKIYASFTLGLDAIEVK